MVSTSAAIQLQPSLDLPGQFRWPVERARFSGLLCRGNGIVEPASSGISTSQVSKLPAHDYRKFARPSQDSPPRGAPPSAAGERCQQPSRLFWASDQIRFNRSACSKCLVASSVCRLARERWPRCYAPCILGICRRACCKCPIALCVSPTEIERIPN